MDLIDLFAKTRLGELVGSIVANLPTVAAIAFVVVVIGLIVWSVMFIGKGGGQYGIIEGYVGTIGAGKTTLAVQHALELARARNAVLLSNIPVICGPTCPGAVARQDVPRPRETGPLPSAPTADEEQWLRQEDVDRARSLRRRRPPRREADQGEHFPLHSIEHAALPINDDGLDLASLMAWAFRLREEQRGLVLLMDEVGVVMPARLWAQFPVGLMWLLQQSRKLAVEWIWTAQDVSFVDHQLRSLSAVVHYVRSFPPPSIWRRAKGKRPWFLVASAYTPMNAPRANGEGGRAEKRIGRRTKRYQRKWELAFDTDGVVLPSKHMKGAEALIDAVRRHGTGTIVQGTMGEGMGGSIEPGQVLTPAGARDA